MTRSNFEKLKEGDEVTEYVTSIHLTNRAIRGLEMKHYQFFILPRDKPELLAAMRRDRDELDARIKEVEGVTNNQ